MLNSKIIKYIKGIVEKNDVFSKNENSVINDPHVVPNP